MPTLKAMKVKGPLTVPSQEVTKKSNLEPRLARETWKKVLKLTKSKRPLLFWRGLTRSLKVWDLSSLA
jgi:hypothetical protein